MREKHCFRLAAEVGEVILELEEAGGQVFVYLEEGFEVLLAGYVGGMLG